MANYKIAILVGSLRKDSINRKVARSICAIRGDNLDCTMVEIGDLPLYNQEYDEPGNTPEQYTRFRDEVSRVRIDGRRCGSTLRQCIRLGR